MPASLADCLTLYNAGNYAAAREVAAALMAAAPHDLKVRSVWAGILAETGEPGEALRFVEEILAEGDGQAFVLHMAARVFVSTGRLEQAEVQFRRVLEISPDDMGARVSLGRVLITLEKYDAALQTYNDIAASGETDFPVQRGALNWMLGHFEEADAILLAHLAGHPNDAAALSQQGLVKKSLGDYGAAVSYFRRAAEAAPDHDRAYLNLAVALQECGQPDAALSALERIRTPTPSARLELLKVLMLPVIVESDQSIDSWRDRFSAGLTNIMHCDDVLTDPLAEVGLNHFHLAYQGRNDRDFQRRMADAYLKLCPSLGAVAPHGPMALQGRRIKIAFVSLNLRNHTVGLLNIGFIEHLDRSRFEITLVSYAVKGDAVYDRIARAADTVLTVPGDLVRAREMIANAQFDIVYYPDIGMHAFTYYLAFARLAPVQAVGWGHPVTTGIPNVDYFVSCDDMEPDNAAEHYTEELVRLPDAGGYYERPKHPSEPFDRTAHDLPAGVPLLTCPQSCFKFHPNFDAILKRILDQVPDAQLVLLTSVPATNSALLQDRLKRTLGTVAARVHFVGPLSHDDFLRLVRDADAVLDIPQWSGGRSGYEALAMGAAVVHLPGEFMRGRHTGAFYKIIGVSDCIAADEDAYVDLAVRLLTDNAFRSAVRQKISSASNALFERLEPVRALERFFIQAVERATAKL